MDLNKVILIGRLVRDPESRMVQGGVTLTRMRIAVNRKRSPLGQSEADFIDVVAWRQLGELCARSLKKGSRIAVEGSLRQRSWQDQDGNFQNRIEVEASNIQFLDPKPQIPEAVEIEEPLLEEPIEIETQEPPQQIMEKSGFEESMRVLDEDINDFDIEDFTFEGGDK
jgi:single-strand DNA-binding protein